MNSFESTWHLRARLALAKVPLCLLIGFSTFFGCLLASSLRGETVLVSLAIFILATGCASLNSLQEYRLDAQLSRTSNRPLVQGHLSVLQAFVQSTVLIALGLSLLLLLTQPVLPFFCSVLSLFLYNVVYTPLKQHTFWAIIPGALCGALPPYIGWLAVGGDPFSFPAVLLLSLLLLWQLPHFWLVLLSHKDDYKNNSLPTFLKQVSESQLRSLLVTWVGALGVIMAMYVILPHVQILVLKYAVIANAIILVITFSYTLLVRKSFQYRRLFLLLNCSFILHMLFVVAGRLFVTPL